MRHTISAIVATALVALAQPAFANNNNLILNGGFEEDTISNNPGFLTRGVGALRPGGSTNSRFWQVTSGDVDYVISSFAGPAFEGTQYLDLVGFNAGTIRQIVPTQTGVDYLLTFVYSHNSVSVSSASANVSIDGNVSTVSHSTGNGSDLDWQTFSQRFRATQGLTTLSFTNTAASGNNGGIFLDAVSIAGVPEPTTWAMMIGGFGLVGGAMRRRSSLGAAIAA